MDSNEENSKTALATLARLADCADFILIQDQHQASGRQRRFLLSVFLRQSDGRCGTRVFRAHYPTAMVAAGSSVRDLGPMGSCLRYRA
jgi:hypothetical protein